MKRIITVVCGLAALLPFTFALTADVAHAQSVSLSLVEWCNAEVGASWDGSTGTCTVSLFAYVWPDQTLIIETGETLELGTPTPDPVVVVGILGTLINHGTVKIGLHVDDQGFLLNAYADGAIYNYGTITVGLDSDLITLGAVYNHGTISLNAAPSARGELDNGGVLENYGTINNSGWFRNRGTFLDCGILNNIGAGIFDNMGTIIECTVAVDIDIKPGSEPNCFNNNGHGVIPVAVLGSADFDATEIDPATVALEGLAVKTVGKKNKLLVHIDDVNDDGFDDLVAQIQDQEGAFSSGSGTAKLTGNLRDGTPFEGTDEVCVVP